MVPVPMFPEQDLCPTCLMVGTWSAKLGTDGTVVFMRTWHDPEEK